jgi:hypothetical protein
VNVELHKTGRDTDPGLIRGIKDRVEEEMISMNERFGDDE